MTPKQMAAVDRVPASTKALLERVFNRDASPREAIKAKCQECMGYTDVANAIRNCSSQTCPLLAYRPFRVARTAQATDLTG